MAIEKSNSELNALISLLDEPNDSMFGQIKSKLLVYGNEAIPHLEDAWENSFDSVLQGRIENIIHGIQLEHLHNELFDWQQQRQYDLLKGFYLVTKYQYPDLSEDDISRKIELIKRDVWLELNNGLTALEKIKVLNHILFDIHGFTGNKVNIDAPQNLFLNNLLESKKGNHLSIGILYIIIAQKLGMPVFGVNLPHHFVLAFVDETHDERIKMVNENEVLFYINPFNKGAVFTQKEIELFIKHLNLRKNSSYYKPCSNMDIIKRHLETMEVTFQKLGYTDKVNEIKSLLKVFSS